MSDYRSYGATENCHGCRYWSEMLAQSINGGPIQAMCLGDGKSRGWYTTARQSCDSWASGHLGAVDSPGEDVTAAYAEEDQSPHPSP